MTNIIPFVNLKQAQDLRREQACQWMVKLDDGASEEELQQLKGWLSEHPANVKLLLEVAYVWDQTSVLSELSEIFPLQKYSHPKPSRQWRRPVLALSAMVFCISVVAAWMFDRNEVYETPVGEQFTVSLSDESEIILNTDTKIEVAFSKSARDVTLLRGEAHFSVTRDVRRPFRVKVGDAVIEAVGTAFAVQRLNGESLEVTVTEGKVNFFQFLETVDADSAGVAGEPDESVADADAPMTGGVIELSAGDSFRLNEVDDSIETKKMRTNEIESKLAWRRGMLLFQGDSLEQVIKEVSRYTTLEIAVDESVRDIEVVGYFMMGNIDGLLLTMSETFNLNYEEIDSTHIRLSAK